MYKCLLPLVTICKMKLTPHSGTEDEAVQAVIYREASHWFHSLKQAMFNTSVCNLEFLKRLLCCPGLKDLVPASLIWTCQEEMSDL